MRARLALPMLALAACTRFGPLYPARPNPSEGPTVADPPPSRVVVHLAIASSALRSALDAAVPTTGDGSAGIKYEWQREPLDVSFSQGRIVLRTKVNATLETPLHKTSFPIDVRVDAEPVVNASYEVKLQSVEVNVGSSDTRLAIADRFAGVYAKIADPITEKLRAFSYDLRPLLTAADARVAAPIDLPLGDAHGCAKLRVLGVEAGPTVLADGIEKDFALLVAPSILLPCPDDATDAADGGAAAATLPPMSNVAAIPSGPFTVTMAIAARYDELTRAMGAAFTDGKLFFSTEHPGLYLENPELYESQGALILKLHIAGTIETPVSASLNGDLYLSGHPSVVDDELVFADLEPTIETKNFLLSLKAMMDGDRIRDQARAALRLDLGERLRPVREKLSSNLTFGSSDACVHGDLDRVAIAGVYAHAAYLRVYVDVTARARASMPCGQPLPGP